MWITDQNSLALPLAIGLTVTVI